MTVANIVDIHALNCRFSEEIERHKAPIAEIWLRESRGAAEVWIITDLVDLDRERVIYEVAVTMMEAFPDIYLDFRVLNPMNFPNGSNLRDNLPRGVERIEPRAS